MTPELFKQTEAMMRDAEEMRAFYQSVGISAETIERPLQQDTSSPLPIPSRRAVRRCAAGRRNSRRSEARSFSAPRMPAHIAVARR